MMKPMLKPILVACGLFFVGAPVSGLLNTRLAVNDAQAIVGRPITPLSVAGVARRTTRRVIRRTSVYVAALPGGCSTVVVEGAKLYLCGSTYYQAYGGKFVVVTVE